MKNRAKKSKKRNRKIVRKMVKRLKKTKKNKKIRKKSALGGSALGRKDRRPTKKAKRKTVKKPKKILKSRKKTPKRASHPKTIVGKGILEQLFESRAKVKLMKFFFRNPEDSFQFRDILKMLRISPSIVRQDMNKLEKLGLVRKTKKQKRVVYYLDTSFDFFKELKDLILKSTISSKGELINDIRKTGNIKLLVLAGVFRGKDGAEADLLVVGDKINQRKFSTFLKDLEAEVGKELNCALMSAKEFNYRYDMYNRFVRDLISEDSDILINKLNLW